MGISSICLVQHANASKEAKRLNSEPRNLLTLFMALSGIVSTSVYRETASCKDHVPLPHETCPQIEVQHGSFSSGIFISQAHTQAISSEFRQAVEDR